MQEERARKRQRKMRHREKAEMKEETRKGDKKTILIEEIKEEKGESVKGLVWQKRPKFSINLKRGCFFSFAQELQGMAESLHHPKARPQRCPYIFKYLLYSLYLNIAFTGIEQQP